MSEAYRWRQARDFLLLARAARALGLEDEAKRYVAKARRARHLAKLMRTILREVL